MTPAAALASSPVVWQHPAGVAQAGEGRAMQPPSAGDGGRADGVSVGETGVLTLSQPRREVLPAASKLTPPPLLWSAVVDSAGDLYVGSGNAGEVIRIDKKGVAETRFDSDELGVRAMAASATGDLYVATFPTGGVYRIRPGREAEPWFDPEDRYIWAMTLGPDDNLFVGTGERGVIYRVAGQAQGAAVFDSDEAHITALALDRSGHLIAGTAPDGLLYRVGTGGKAETLLDSGLAEITAVTLTEEGVIYAAAIGEETPPPVRRAGERSDLTIEVTPAPDGSFLEEEAEQPRKITIDLAELLAGRPSAREGAAARIYRLEAGRAPVLAWKSDSERVLSLSWSRRRGLLFGTGGAGGEGRIYKLESDGTATILHQMREPQVTALTVAADDRLYACTSNPGRVYLLEGGTVAAGTYESAVYDAGRAARWGSIRWDAEVPAGTRAEIMTRSGNRPSPDESWSDWSPPYADPKGSAVVSPPARYAQWKADLSRLKTDAAPLLREVAMTLLPENSPPQVEGLRVLDPGAAAPRDVVKAGDEKTVERKGGDAEGDDGKAGEVEAGDTPARDKRDGATRPPKGSRWVVWSGSDPDGDRLSHTLWIGRRGETELRKLADGVASSPWPLDDTSLAEGRYVLKIEASDSPTNGSKRALAQTRTSLPFLVDHTAPRLQVRTTSSSGGRLAAEVTATDAVGAIARAELSVQGAAGSPSPLPCGDGICDTGSESFLIDVPDPGPGRAVTLRVFDTSGNMASSEIASGSRKEEN